MVIEHKTFTAIQMLENCAKAQDMDMDDFIPAFLISLMNLEFN